jgi:hypothetical protein
VDGAAHVVGSSAAEAEKLVKSAAAVPHVALTLVQAPIGDNPQAEVSIGALPAGLSPRDVRLYAASLIDQAASDVKRGENSGRKLTHSNLVSELVPLGSVSLSTAGSHIKIPLPKSAASSNHHLVLFLQDPTTLHILGATQVRFPQ